MPWWRCRLFGSLAENELPVHFVMFPLGRDGFEVLRATGSRFFVGER